MALNIHESLLSALGSVTANFAFLDQTVQFIIWILLFGNDSKQQPFGKAVTAGLSFRKQIALFSTVYRLRFPDQDYARLESLCRKLRAVEVKRNRATHSLWAGGYDGKAFRFKTTADDKLKHQIEDTDVASVRALANEIGEAATDVQKFLADLMTPEEGKA